MVADLKPFGTLKGGRDVQVITLKAGGLEARILDQGARIIWYRRGDAPNVHVTSENLSDFERELRYAGPIIGPVINRIAGARAEINGVTHTFDANQDGHHTLHSGRIGAQNAIWTIDEASQTAVTLSVALANGEGGFPGNRRITARYALEDDGLTLTITATTDAATLMNPGSHGVWNVEGTPTWAGQVLEIPTARYLPSASDNLPTGEIADVTGSVYDHQTPKAPDPTLDNNYCFEPGFGLRARLIGSTQTLEIHSDAPGFQAYAGGSNGIALEPQLWPDAPNNRHFPSILLTPGESFHQRSRFLITQ